MATNIKLGGNPYEEKLITLNGDSYYLTVMYNSSDDVNNDGNGAWYFDIADRNKTEIISGIKIIPSQNLTSKYLSLSSSLGGDLWCVNVKDDTADIGRDNLGENKKFRLWYISNTELSSLES